MVIAVSAQLKMAGTNRRYLGTAHCADMYPARTQDKRELILAREIIDLNIGSWLRG
jgi:hypothetical protein